MPIIAQKKFNKKSMRKKFNDIPLSQLVCKSYLEDREVPKTSSGIDKQIKTLFEVPVCRQIIFETIGSLRNTRRVHKQNNAMYN